MLCLCGAFAQCCCPYAKWTLTVGLEANTLTLVRAIGTGKFLSSELQKSNSLTIHSVRVPKVKFRDKFTVAYAVSDSRTGILEAVRVV